MKLVARQRKVVGRNLSHVNLHLARCLHRVAVVQHAPRLADFRDPLDREQHTRFVIRPHERHHGGLIRDGSFQVSQIQ